MGMLQYPGFSSHNQVDAVLQSEDINPECWELPKFDLILEKPLHGTSPYRVLGDLILPAPSTCGLNEVHQNLADILMAYLQQLQSRDLSRLRKPSPDLRQAFEEFKMEEASCWEAVGRAPLPRDDFVCPSGSLRSPIMHHLHQPSYSTSYVDLENAETADWTNGCVAMIMGNGFEQDKSFIFDHLHRRSEKSEGYNTYPEAVLQCHEMFTRRIRESLEAKVELIYGKRVKTFIFQKQNTRFTVLPLWGPWQGVMLYLEHESNFDNREEGQYFRRVNIFMSHPQRLFFVPPQSAVSVQQDLNLSAAVKLASIRIPFAEDWYQKRKWRTVVPNLRPTETRARAVSAMTNSKQKKNLSEINIKDMDTIARHSRLRGLKRKINRGEQLTESESIQLTDLGNLGTNANPRGTTKPREIKVGDVDHQGRIRHEQALGEILRPTGADKIQQIDLRLPLQVFTTATRVVLTRKPKRKLQDMDVEEMDQRAKRDRRRTLKQKIARYDKLTSMDLRQARALGIPIPEQAY